MAIDYTKPSLALLPVIIVQWFDQTRRYVCSDQSLTIDGNVYGAVPELSIDPIELSGGTDSKEVFFTVPSDIDPFPFLILGPFARVTVSTGMIDRDDLSQPPTITAKGKVTVTENVYQGKSGLMRVTLALTKSLLKGVSLGIKCTDRCPLFFGDGVCGATVASVTGTVATITGTSLVLSVLPSDSNKGAWGEGRYTRGRVQLDGLRIMIRKHVVGTKTLILAKKPPLYWIGQNVTVFEGCDKTIVACTAHGRQSRFLGAGRAMPDHNPIIEEG